MEEEGRGVERKTRKRKQTGLRTEQFLMLGGLVLAVLLSGSFVSASVEENGKNHESKIVPVRKEVHELSVTYKVTEVACQVASYLVVQLRRKKGANHVCTGVLIGPQAVVAPASCVSKDRGLKWAESYPDIMAGSCNISEEDTNLISSTIKQDIHPGFNGSIQDGFLNDVAVLHLSKALGGENYLPLKNPPATEDCILESYGWFTPATYGSRPTTMHKIPKQKIVPKEECEDQLAPKVLHPKTVCATTINERKTFCDWDPGSPLVAFCLVKDSFVPSYLVGVASYRKSEKCTTAAYVYSSLAEHKEWIKSKVQ